MHDSLTTFLKVLDPSDNTTGGGTASAVAGAMAAALVALVARLSAGKAGMAAAPPYAEIDAEAETLSRRLLAGGQEDAAAFEAVRAAVRLPKGTDAERSVRLDAIQAAFICAAGVPLTRMRPLIWLARSTWPARPCWDAQKMSASTCRPSRTRR
jgi:formiminotetrahydrofolate cyclodeaminase